MPKFTAWIPSGECSRSYAPYEFETLEQLEEIIRQNYPAGKILYTGPCFSLNELSYWKGGNIEEK